METLFDRSAIVRLLDQYSIEITGSGAKPLEEAKALFVPGTQVSVAFLANEDTTARVDAARAAKALGFIPMPHIAARRLRSEHELAHYLDRLQSEVGVDRAFVIAGDPSSSLGPYEDALGVVRSGLLAKYGIRKVGISGYPDGHRDISSVRLWQALADKLDLLADSGHEVEIISQFAFDPDPVLNWLEHLRREGITASVRIGIPGPTNVVSLLRMASKLGVSSAGGVVAKYGLSLTKLFGVAGPEAFLKAFADRLLPELHGEVRLHFYTFGSLQRTGDWISKYRPPAVA